ncbi:MAG: multiheme c-type cytochrome [Deltaproteobacteria bacterium]|nr:multiheme c-type cytochrome [Deltaproteobacteria bacterium]
MYVLMFASRWISSLALLALASLGSLAGSTSGCNSRRVTVRPTPTSPDARTTPRMAEGPPTVRLYFLVDLDGYFEPCGCNSRPLGGIDRLARYIRAEQPRAPENMLIAVGDLLFRDPTMDERMVYQETRKAESLVQILDQLGLAAYAPGPSDYVRGAEERTRILANQRASALAANVDPATQGYRPGLIRTVNGHKIGLVGVSDFRPTSETPAPAGAPATTDPTEAARAAVARLRSEGAELVVVLASVTRRDAVSIARNVPGVDFVIVAREESNTPPPPERVGRAYVLSAPNQGKFVGVLDLYLRAPGAISDASESSAVAVRASLDRRIRELQQRLEAWRRDPSVDPAAVAQQSARLVTLQSERAAANGEPEPPASGSYFRARATEISPDLPKESTIEQSIARYFSTVNEHNREAYASLQPPPPLRGQPRYVGGEECRSCHEAAFAIWERTPHSRAYWTLDVLHKNFNLSCVGCHVTGYQRPGGSEVVQNDGLRDVQCETCHGPGSAHIAASTDAQRRATIIRNPPQAFCATQCHTPEHSDHFDYAQYLPRILGPGHGYPEDSADAGGVRLSAPIIANGQNTDAGAH